jgi:hypothetical protein
VAEAEATLGEAEVEAAGVATSREAAAEAEVEAAGVATSREAAAEAVDVVTTPQTVEAAAVAAVVASLFLVDRQEVVVAVALREEVRKQWLLEYTCTFPLPSGTKVTSNGISHSQCQYTDLDAVQTHSPHLRIPKSQNSKTPGLR